MRGVRRWAWLLVGAALVVASFAPSAAGGNVATPQMREIASWAAGKPVEVHCESDDATWTAMLASVGLVGDHAGFARIGASAIYIGPAACSYLFETNSTLGYGLNILLHEAVHARGWADEALTECAARVLIYAALDRFYGVPFFSPAMETIVGVALRYSRSKQPQYQGGCDRL